MMETLDQPAAAPRFQSGSGAALDPRARVILVQALLQYRAAMVTAEAGILDDRDIEALHDYRVAIRRTRSLLKAFDPSLETPRFRDDFAWVAKRAGLQRDLDVFLSRLDDQQTSLGIDADALRPIRALLERRRKDAHAALRRTFAAERYRRFKTDWFHYLQDLRQESEHCALTPEMVYASIEEAWRQVRRRGTALGPRSKMERLHALRKDCKELRYLLETFSGLYDSDRIARMTRRLRTLQDVLGTVCDLRVQAVTLAEIAAEIQGRQQVPAVGAAIRLWRGDLRRQSRRAREQYARRYARLMRKRNQRSFASALRTFRA